MLAMTSIAKIVYLARYDRREGCCAHTIYTTPVVSIHEKGDFEMLVLQVVQQLVRELTGTIIK